MFKNQQNILKIGIGLILFLFIVISPLNTIASEKLNWENPNAGGKNPFKITSDSILNSKTMMQVVGCTGVVDKISSKIIGFVEKELVKIAIKQLKKQIKVDGKARVCEALKSGAVAGVASIVNTTYSLAVQEAIDCPKPSSNQVSSPDTVAAIEKTGKTQTLAEKREACFNGLAYTLAKNQLTSMTRQTINWVNTGFNGNPMYVQNITNLTNSIGKNVLESGIEKLAHGAFPYGGDFSELVIKNYKNGTNFKYGAKNALDNLTSDLGAFLTDKTSYIDTNKDEQKGLTELQKAQEANMRFANDFSVGGWDGWLALTQKDQNNPLGFTMMASQILADRIEEQTNEKKEELSQNDGFMSQKVCDKWQLYDKNGKPLYKKGSSYTNISTGQTEFRNDYVYSPNKSNTDPNHDVCDHWKIITPGSIIKDKLSTYLNSPERQLELAKTINESLNTLFTALIENFRSEGLFGLSQEKYNRSEINNYTDNLDSLDSSENSNYGISASGYDINSFDLTRDLGNTYNHNPTLSLGSWNAKTNTPELHINLGPFDETNHTYYPSGYYYTVSTAGNTRLFNYGYNGWNVGDRAFWNGSEWQNWKSGQTSPILKRGIIQNQKDYIIASKEILKKLPAIMPKLGELDYCIPGPNPNLENNTINELVSFLDFSESLNSLYKEGKTFVRDSTTFSIAQPGHTAYDNYKKFFAPINPPIYNDYRKLFPSTDQSLWTSIQRTSRWQELQYLGSLGVTKKNRAEDRISDAIDAILNLISQDTRQFYQKYTEEVFNNVYEIMQKPFLQKENIEQLIPNTSYVPMINDGYNYTSNLYSQEEEIYDTTQDYIASIIESQSNIAKLKKILSGVSKIIKAAQERRDANLLEQINAIDQNMTVAQYKAEYSECLNEEDILYYNENDIMNDIGGDESIRCSDGLDNDLDGSIDANDTDCYSSPVLTTNYVCLVNLLSIENFDSWSQPENSVALNWEEGHNCESQTTQNNCLSAKYYVDLGPSSDLFSLKTSYRTMSCIWVQS